MEVEGLAVVQLVAEGIHGPDSLDRPQPKEARNF
jgi:hypothetical protein